MNNYKIKSFTDLNTWKMGHSLVLEIYKATKNYARSEKYGLSDQSRRCSVSITSNIAEGFSRRSKKEKQQFYFTAKGSLTELQNQLLIARDIGYINPNKFKEISTLTIDVHKLLNGLIRSLNK